MARNARRGKHYQLKSSPNRLHDYKFVISIERGVISLTLDELGEAWRRRSNGIKARIRLAWMKGECRESRMKIKHRTRTEHTLNKASATLFCRYSKGRIKSHYVYHLNCKSF
ncbi:hypothetical protein HanPI659440_Chr15g0580541 [Helianthus annuus]|nr:hypothetical protein HanPI659440_Chr15g0580541 [Helianthus annuus]